MLRKFVSMEKAENFLYKHKSEGYTAYLIIADGQDKNFFVIYGEDKDEVKKEKTKLIVKLTKAMIEALQKENGKQ
jgi:hypothetical protein